MSDYFIHASIYPVWNVRWLSRRYQYIRMLLIFLFNLYHVILNSLLVLYILSLRPKTFFHAYSIWLPLVLCISNYAFQNYNFYNFTMTGRYDPCSINMWASREGKWYCQWNHILLKKNALIMVNSCCNTWNLAQLHIASLKRNIWVQP